MIDREITIELPSLWKWVQYYINNWRLSPKEMQSVLMALEHSYWQGIISWADFIKCRRLLAARPVIHQMPHKGAKDLFLALTQINRCIQNRYRIEDVRGFVDQGIILQAYDAKDNPYTLLCLTTNVETARALIKQIPEINQLTSPFIVSVRSVIKEGKHLYFLLSDVIGIPLSAYVVTQYPTGMPVALMQTLLKQIYEMIKIFEGTPSLLNSLHPGQLFIEPESMTLQLIPFATDIQESENSRRNAYPSNINMRLIAIAYELLTGCIPVRDEAVVQMVLQESSHIGRSLKRQIAYYLSKDEKSISLSKAVVCLDIGKKRPLLDATLFTLAILCAISAISFQGMRYLPEFLAKNDEVVPQTIVIEQDVQDRHVNLLKAAFFTQAEQANIAGARASWQALQQLLPSDDIFIQNIGPQQLAYSYIVVAEKMMQHDPKASGVLVRAAMQLNPTLELPAHLQALGQLEAPEAPMQELPDDIIALATTLVTSTADMPLPPLPEVKETLTLHDPCHIALTKGNVQSALCTDTLSDRLHIGPRLIAMRLSQDGKPLIITEDLISTADYNQYCQISGACEAKTGSDFNDVATTVQEYNNYCLVTGTCDALYVATEPLMTLTPTEIQAYADWLTQQTGYTYRLPKVEEVQQLAEDNTAQWLLNQTGEWIASLQPSNDSNAIAFRLVRD